MPPPIGVEHLAETEQVALIGAAPMMEHQQTSSITRRRPLLEDQRAHTYILLARPTKNAASQDRTAADTAGKSAFKL
jgi:hypothetical protein